jgi:hypothetical protein
MEVKISGSKKYILYSLIDPDDFQTRYIGVTSQELRERYNQHLCTTSYKHGNHRVNWINKLKSQNKKPIIKALLTTTEDKIEDLEIEMIKHYNSFSKLTNSAKGGFLNKGMTVSKEVRERIANTQRGRKQPQNCHPLILTNLETKEEIEFPSITAAAEYLNCNRLNFSMIIRGEVKSVFGYTCRYKNTDK